MEAAAGVDQEEEVAGEEEQDVGASLAAKLEELFSKDDIGRDFEFDEGCQRRGC